MSREEKIARARELRANGWIYRDIAAELGVAKSTVHAWFVPQSHERKRRWDREHRFPCSRCGSPMAQGSARANGGTTRQVVGEVCAECRSDERVATALEIARLRVETSLNNREIAARVERDYKTVAEELWRMRALGFELPLDPYAIKKGKKPRAKANDDATTLGLLLVARGIEVPAWAVAGA